MRLLRNPGVIIVSLLCLAALFFYFFGAWTTKELASLYLSQQGAKDIIIKINRPTMKGVDLQLLSAKWHGYSIEMQQIHVSYDIAELLNGKVDKVFLQQLTLSSTSAASTLPDDTAQGAGPLKQDIDLATLQLPFSTLSWPALYEFLPIKHLRIANFDYHAGLIRAEGEFSFSQSDLLLKGKFSSHPAGPSLAFSTHLVQIISKEANNQPSPNSRLQFTISHPLANNPLIYFQSTLSYDDDQKQQINTTGSLTVNAEFILAAANNFPADHDFIHYDKPIDITFQLHAPHQRKKIPSSLVGTFKARANLNNSYANIAELELSAAGSFKLDKDLITLSIHPETQALVKFEDLPNMAIPKLALIITKNTQLVYSPANSLLDIDAAAFRLSIPELEYQDTKYYPVDLIINLPKFMLNTATLAEADQTAPGQTASNHSGPNPKITIGLANENSTFTSSSAIRLNDGVMSIKTVTELSATDSFAQQLFSKWPHAVDGNGRISINTATQVDLNQVTLTNLSGSIHVKNTDINFEALSFREINLTAPFSTLNKHIEMGNITLSIGAAELGIPLYNIAGSLSLNDGVIKANEFSAHLLGGHLQSKPFEFSFSDYSAKAEMQFSGLDLMQIVTLADENIKATGILDGDIQLSTSQLNNATLGFQISKGQLQARLPGGLIEYQINSQSLDFARQSGFAFALAAFKHFQYKNLESSITLATDGELKLGVSLLGHNPDVQAGKLIQYNLNIDQNLYDLFRSLSLSDDISTRLGDKFTQ